MARPKGSNTFTLAIGDAICVALVEGKSLREICKPATMPDRTTVLRWLDGDEVFAAKYARARELQADTMDDLILETARASKPLTAQADRVKIDAYKWRAMKLLPKRYGDKQQVDHTNSDGSMKPMDDASAAAKIAAILATAQAVRDAAKGDD